VVSVHCGASIASRTDPTLVYEVSSILSLSPGTKLVLWEPAGCRVAPGHANGCTGGPAARTGIELGDRVSRQNNLRAEQKYRQ
jgi:hypothetical protein